MDNTRIHSEEVAVSLLDQEDPECIHSERKKSSSTDDASSPMLITPFRDHTFVNGRFYDKSNEYPKKPQNDSKIPEIEVSRFPFRNLTNAVPDVLRQNIRRLTRITTIAPVPSYGEKTIGTFSSFIYLVNQIFGAGILALPYVMKVSGWLPCLLANVFVSMVAMFGTLMIMRAMTMIQGNQNFERRVEYIPTVEYFLGKRYSFATEFCFHLAIQSLNAMSIVIVAQSIDHLLLSILGWTVGWIFQPSTLTHGFKFFFSQDQVDVIYSSETQVIFGITLGYFLNALICIPLSSYTMNENMKIQYASFVFLLTSVTQITLSALYRITCSFQESSVCLVASFITSFAQRIFSPVATLTHTVFAFLWQAVRVVAIVHPFTIASDMSETVDMPLAKPTPPIKVQKPRIFGFYQYGQLFSTFLASYSYVNVIPSWANEMKPDVQVNRVLTWSTIFTCAVYYIFGFILAYAYPHVNSDNIFQEILKSKESLDIFTIYSVYIFNLLTVLPGIVVYSITTRYNLVNSGVASPRKSFIIGCLLPFCFAWILANDTYFSTILQWSSLIFSLIVNFIIPLNIYIYACGAQRLAKRNPTCCLPSGKFPGMSYSSSSKDNQLSMGQISLILQDYLKSLPSDQLDPDLRRLVTRSFSSNIFPSSYSSSKSLYSGIDSNFFPASSLYKHKEPSNDLVSSLGKSLSPTTSSPSMDLVTHSRSPMSSQASEQDEEHRKDRLSQDSAELLPSMPSVVGKNHTSQSAKTSPCLHTNHGKPLALSQHRLSDIWITKSCVPKKNSPHACSKDFYSESLYSRDRYTMKEGYADQLLFSHDLKCYPDWSYQLLNDTENKNHEVDLSFKVSGESHWSKTQQNQLSTTVLNDLASQKNISHSWPQNLSRLWKKISRPIQYFSFDSLKDPPICSKNGPDSIHHEGFLSDYDPSSYQEIDFLSEEFKRSRLQEAGADDHHKMDTCHNLSMYRSFQNSEIVFRRPPHTRQTCVVLNDSTTKKVTAYQRLSDSSSSLDGCKDYPSELGHVGVSFKNGQRENSTGPFSLGGDKNKKRVTAKQHTLLEPLNQTSKKQPSSRTKSLKPVLGAEDAYECDEIPGTDELKPIRIHVFPRGPLRTYHLTTTRILMCCLVTFCALSVGLQLLIDVLQLYGWIVLPDDD